MYANGRSGVIGRPCGQAPREQSPLQLALPSGPLLAPPPARTRDGRGSVSAPATPVDEPGAPQSALASGASPASPNTSASRLAKFIMLKKVNSSGGAVSPAPGSSGSAVDGVLKELAHPAHSDALKAHGALTVRLLKTGNSSRFNSAECEPFPPRRVRRAVRAPGRPL